MTSRRPVLSPYWTSDNGETTLTLYQGDVLEVLRQMPAESVQCVVTSPPYWGLRDYGTEGQIGLEKTPEEYVAKMVEVFREVRRVLRRDGTLWLNMGDAYASDTKGSGGIPPGSIMANRPNSAQKSQLFAPIRVEHGLKAKDLLGMPWRVAFALQADGWWLRSDIIWSKPNPMPESVTDRPTKAHEYLFLMTKAERYFYDADAIREKGLSEYRSSDFIPSSDKDLRVIGRSAATGASWNGRTDEVIGGFRNKRTVWEIATEPYPEAHFATFPQKLVEPCVLAGCPEGGTVLDPFVGSGTTLLVAQRLGRNGIGIDLSEPYLRLAVKRLEGEHAQMKLRMA